MKNKKKKKPTKAEIKAALEAEEHAQDCEALIGGTLLVIEGWKQMAIDKIASDAPCAWHHGMELAKAVEEFEAAYHNIMETIEQQCNEHDAMRGEKTEPEKPSNN